jgi:hypothetical protein
MPTRNCAATQRASSQSSHFSGRFLKPQEIARASPIDTLLGLSYQSIIAPLLAMLLDCSYERFGEY